MPQKITDAERAEFWDLVNTLYVRIEQGDAAMKAVLARLTKMVEGEFGIKSVDLDAEPRMPEKWRGQGWKILPDDQLPNRVRGFFICDLERVQLYFSKDQDRETKALIKGLQLLEELKSQTVFSDVLLDFLLIEENQHLIPESWKQHYVFFWGTVYRDPRNSLCVRYLRWDRSEGKWIWEASCLLYELDYHSPAAARAI